MEITNISVQKNEKEDPRVLGYATIVFDDCLKINGIKIINGNTKIYASMPHKKLQNGTYKDFVHPITKEFRDLIDNRVKEEYEKLLEE